MLPPFIVIAKVKTTGSLVSTVPSLPARNNKLNQPPHFVIATNYYKNIKYERKISIYNRSCQGFFDILFV